MSNHLPYRQHIDGLRAIAVISVLIFHVLPGSLPGGFTGVDIFFVISGFLISKIIYTEVGQKSFSIVRFYERRARRIVPAFTVVSIAASVAGIFLLYPSEMIRFANSLMASLFFSANVYLYFTSDYFAPTADTMPLLHYWTLGVEEQFYVVFPILILALAKLPTRYLRWVLVLLCLASLLASDYLTRHDPTAAFYLLPFRADELLIGCIIALPGNAVIGNRAIAGAVSLVGCGLMACAVLLFDDRTRFPGFAALLPCLGAATVIWSGEGSPNVVSEALSRKTMKFFGQISYSLYLVHWPVYVFAKRLFPNVAPNLLAAVLIPACVLLGYLSYRYVEQPVRRARNLTTLRTFGYSGVAAACVMGLSILIVVEKGFPTRINHDVADVLAYLNYNPRPYFREGTCFLDPEQTAADWNETQCMPHGQKSFAILWGDSTAADLYWGFAPALTQAGLDLGQMTASACPPIADLVVAARPNCKAFNDFALSVILKSKPAVVVMSTNWDISEPSMQLFDATILKLTKAGIRVAVLGRQPYYKRQVPTILAARWQKGDFDTSSRDDLDWQPLDDIESVMRAHLSRVQGADYISVLGSLCPRESCSLVVGGKTPMEFDVLHLTAEGSLLYGRILVPLVLRSMHSS